MHLAPAGDRAILVELGEVSAAGLHAANARVQALSGVVRSIPGHSSLYVIFDRAPDREALQRAVETTSTQQPATGNAARDVPVSFDGENFEEFLIHTGVSREEFLKRVDGLRLVARYLGFRGGFAYLDGWPEEWSMPRRATSRPVRRGSFAIAGSVAAFYPIDTPGGWNVLGRTDVNLENAIAAGDELSLRVVESSSRQEAPRLLDHSTTRLARVEILSAPLAVWTRAPFDDIAAAIANHAVGNDASEPLFECPLAGPKLRFTRDAVVAWCTPSLDVRVERVHAGEERAFGRVSGGLRAYLAIGDREGVVARVERDERQTIRALAGPHLVLSGDVECEVTPQLDRVGIRLRPLRPIEVKAPADLRSIGMQCGTVQLHPDGSLVAMGPDHPITGGYLQPMTVLWEERWKLGQLVPGERVVFVLS
jgi:allophanate hydrolase subunit 1